MEPSTSDGNQDLVQFWDEVPAGQSLKRHVPQNAKPDLRLATKNYNTGVDPQRIQATLLHVTDSCVRLERKLDHSLWHQKVFLILVTVLTALWGFTVFIHYSSSYSKRST
ncbi:motile sperm domain-containing protein 2-like [Clinocottus analis]|uniref:motile sperm domain-containing protein 2-like n=1 Tax=Clinocottus analis TaxID=304258 RepID=UPI0035BFEC4E